MVLNLGNDLDVLALLPKHTSYGTDTISTSDERCKHNVYLYAARRQEMCHNSEYRRSNLNISRGFFLPEKNHKFYTSAYTCT